MTVDDMVHLYRNPQRTNENLGMSAGYTGVMAGTAYSI